MFARVVSRTACFAARPIQRQRGFTIAEVFAALLVVIIGLIGIASLYGDAAQTQPETQPQAIAERLAQNMAARIVANAAGRTGYASVVGVLCVTTGRDSRPHYAAAQEAACWQDEVEEHLPSGTGSITRDTSTNPPTYVIAVSWSAVGAGAASYVLRVQPDR
jgi:type IV pilus modification protein PilV